MRWRSSGGESTTSALEKDNEASTATSSSSTSPSGSSPIGGVGLVGGVGDDEPDSSTASSSSSTPAMAATTAAATATATTATATATTSSPTNNNHNNLRRNRPQIPPTAAPDIAVGSAADPDGDPPYEDDDDEEEEEDDYDDEDDDEDDDDDDEGYDDDDDDEGYDDEDEVVEEETNTSSSSAGGPVSSISSSMSRRQTAKTRTALSEQQQQQVGVSGGDSDTAKGAGGPFGANDDDDDDDDSDQEIPWKPQATQSTCEFTHTITNYSQKRDSGCKKAEYSATTVDEFGNRWRLIVYVNGNGRASNHHLSLFLQVADAEELPFGWKKAVSYVLTLEHPTGPNLSYAKRNPDKTFKLCPKAIDWGWSQFITSDRIQQEGFVQNDSLVVRASVTVKSSSVCIDLEDAELYLKCAVEEGKPEAVQLCLDQGASVNCQFKDDLYTPLHTACSSSTAEDDSSNNNNNINSSSNSNSNSNSSSNANISSSSSSNANVNNEGSMKVLNLLLEKGADGNACNKWRETPLLIAANNGHRAAVEALLKHGADPSLCSEAGWSALTFAAHKGYDDIVALLLRAGAPVNCRVTEDSSTPLHKACAGSKAGHLIAVKLLLDNGADVHALNKWRETPLLTAANHGQAGAVEALLKAGADPCKCTDTGWSPLSIAAYKGHDDVVKLLLEEGAPTEEADPTLSALLQAATKGLPGTVELLLKHGADHTVTTKKGDTALSILVEQNLIDAAVEMVTEYKASVPRCSRDRKKVQRARLLINLRVKQHQREGKKVSLVVEDDEDETDQEDDPEVTPQHDEHQTQSTKLSKKKNKKKKNKMTAEEQAKAAEEALLLELEQEDADRQKLEVDANKKSAKKRKKKERERLQKKEQEDQRLEEEREHEAKLRKQREAKEAKDRTERERLATIKRKGEDEERKRLQTEIDKQKREQQQREAELRKKEQQKKKQQEKIAAAATSKANGKGGKRQPQSQTPAPASIPATRVPAANPSAPISRNAAPLKFTSMPAKNSSTVMSKQVAPATARPAVKNRGWETKPVLNQATEPKQPPTPIGTSTPQTPVNNQASSSSLSSHFLSPQSEKAMADPFFSTTAQPVSSPFAPMGEELGNMLNPQPPAPPRYTQSEPALNGMSSSSPFPLKTLEMPAVALFRRDKVSELLQRCALARSPSDALGVVSELTIKKVLYRWMVRATHESSPCLDCIIPSWLDFELLTTFFQRQFISESRKGINTSAPGASMVSMEALREAGSAMSLLCHSLAKDVADFRRRVEEQLPHEWTDSTIGMNASDMMRNGGNSSMVLVDWANRSQVYMQALTFSKLRERFAGVPSRLLSSIFTAKVRYETKHLLVADTVMDFCLPPDTQSTLAMKASVSAEIWSDPFTAMSGTVFWGQFADVDSAFGGLKPFSTEEGGEDLLARHGGSVSVVPPLDNMVASRYVHRMFDILESADQNRIPISFAVFLRAECFLDWNNAPTINDLHMLDPRLRDNVAYLIRVEPLAPGQHSFFCEKSGSLDTSTTGSLFVLMQNEAGRARFNLRDSAVADIIRSLGGVVQLAIDQNNFAAPISFPNADYGQVQASNNDPPVVTPVGYFESRAAPVSPMPHQTISADFGAIGGTNIAHAFSSSAPDFPAAPSSASGARRPARGRLFDLVDDGEEDNLNDVDVVSGMLGNLNMDLFQQSNNSNEIDIEAISLMGIGGPPSQGGGLQPRARGRFG